MRIDYFTGLDLGQTQDYTAIAVVERIELEGDWDGAMWAKRKKAELRLRHLERVPLGTPYPDVVSRAARVVDTLRAGGTSYLIPDATGVGRPVVNMLQAAGLGNRMWPVSITGGPLERLEKGIYLTPKRDLIVGLQILLQEEKLVLASGMEFEEALLREMQTMQVRVGVRSEQYGQWREGEHDDLVLAVALACWGARKVHGSKVAGDCGWCVREGADRIQPRLV
jgi:hypothetical protein